MKKNETNMILILLAILIIVIIIFIVKQNKKTNIRENSIIENTTTEEYVQILDDQTKLNTSTKLNEAKEVNGFKFENIQLTQKNGQTILLADVTNNTEKTKNLTLVDVILLDKSGNEIIKVGGIISPLQPGEKKQFNTSMTADYANVYDFKIVIK